MADVRRVVETVFKAVDMASAPMTGIASAAMRAASAVSSMISPLTAVVGGVASLASFHGLMDLHSEAEDTARAMGGMFASLGQADDFRQGMTMAAQVMRQITVDAARLPGEAEDYIQVFRAGLPSLSGAFNNNMSQMTALSNRYTAVMSTLQVSVSEASEGLSRMLGASATGLSEMNPALRTLLPFMARATEGTAHQVRNAADFVRLTQTQRGEVMRLTLQQQGLTDMLNDAAESWGAQTGTLKSMLRMMLRQATTPIFQAATRSLGQFNALFMDSDGNFTRTGRTVITIGRLISTHLVSGIRRAVDLAGTLGSRLERIGEGIAQQPWFAGLQRIMGRSISIGMHVMQDPGMRNAALGIVARAAMGPVGALVGPLIAFSHHTEAVNSVLNSLVSIGMGLLPLFEPLMGLVAMLNEVMGELIAAILPPLMEGIAMLIPPIVEFAQGVIGLVQTLVSQLRPHLLGLAQSIDRLVRSLGEVLAPIIRIVGNILMQLYQNTAQYLVPVITTVIGALRQMIDGIARFLSWLGRQLNQSALAQPRNAPTPPGVENQTNVLEQVRNAINAGNEAQERQAQAMNAANGAARRATPAARGGSRTYNDFRNSRFDITQRFAEGFDPDRVAVAFANDLEAMADRRLQSGLEPVFGVN
jgi:hypothetical protein